jgi:hypothetical protein
LLRVAYRTRYPLNNSGIFDLVNGRLLNLCHAFRVFVRKAGGGQPRDVRKLKFLLLELLYRLWNHTGEKTNEDSLIFWASLSKIHKEIYAPKADICLEDVLFNLAIHFDGAENVIGSILVDLLRSAGFWNEWHVELG